MTNTHIKHLLSQGSTVLEALSKLDELARDAIIFIVNEDNKLIGSLTDGDVRRGFIKGYNTDSLVDDVLNKSPHYIRKGEKDFQKIIEFRESDYRIIPILDKEGRVINVINFKEVKSFLPADAVIMAGGRGERLRPLTDTTPKPLLRVGDKPIMEYTIDRLQRYGIENIWITLNYLGDKIENHFGNGEPKNIRMKYVYENKPLGTIGSLSSINDFENDYIIVSNSDLLTNIDYEHFFLDFINQDADLSVVTIPYSVDVPYAVLECSNGNIVNFHEKPTYTYFSNGGIYLMKKEVLQHIPEQQHFNATDLIEKLIASGKKVISYALSGYWLDIGKREDYEKAQGDINNIMLK